jgi:hypothetical protein
VPTKTNGITAKSNESKARRRDVESKVISKLTRLYTNIARKAKEITTDVKGSASTKLTVSPFEVAEVTKLSLSFSPPTCKGNL